MSDKSEPKHEVGDWITSVSPYYGAPVKQRGKDDAKMDLKNHRIPMQVIERLIQDCPGGRQIHYKVRPHFVEVRADSFRAEAYYQDWGGTDLKQFNEIEVEAYTEEMEASNAEIPKSPEAEEGA